MWRRIRRGSGAVAVIVVVVGAGVTILGPLRDYLDQRAAIADTEATSAGLAAELTSMTNRAEQLLTDSEIERRARRDGWIFPGEEAYQIFPVPAPALPIPEGWPFTRRAAVEQ